MTRQWVIDIEKGKPRAELGLSLSADAKQEVGAPPGSEGKKHHAGEASPKLDINTIVERHRTDYLLARRTTLQTWFASNVFSNRLTKLTRSWPQA